MDRGLTGPPASRTTRDEAVALRPERALAHPLWLAALALLALNDHVFKGSGMLPDALTGKISDFAGLVVAPALLAALVRASRRGALLACHAVVGVAFALLEVSPAAAASWDALLTAAGVPSRSWSDATDLVALVSLALSWRVLVPAMARPARARRIVEWAAAAAGVLFCTATSKIGGCPDDPAACEEPHDDFAGNCGEGTDAGADGRCWPVVQASIYLYNAADGARAVWIRRPVGPKGGEGVEGALADCAAVAENPGLLGDADFGPPDASVAAAGRIVVVAAATQGECDAAWIEADDLPPAILFWFADDYPARPILDEPLGAGERDDPGGVTMDMWGWRQIGDGPAILFEPE